MNEVENTMSKEDEIKRRCERQCRRAQVAERWEPKISRLKSEMADAHADWMNAKHGYKAALMKALENLIHSPVEKAAKIVEARMARYRAADVAHQEAQQAMWAEQDEAAGDE